MVDFKLTKSDITLLMRGEPLVLISELGTTTLYVDPTIRPGPCDKDLYCRICNIELMGKEQRVKLCRECVDQVNKDAVW